MTVERPNAGVVRVELKDDVAVWTDHLHVASHGIRGVHDRCAVPGARAFVEDIHVGAVQVHGVTASVSRGSDGVGKDLRCGSVILNDHPYRRVGVGISYIPNLRKADITLVCKQQWRRAVVAPEADTIELPEPDVRLVEEQLNGNVVCK